MNLRNLLTATVIQTAAIGALWAQSQQYVVLDIAWNSAVSYVDDVLDPAKNATLPGPVSINPSVKNLEAYMVIGDLVSVNGKPVKGNFVIRGRVFALSTTAAPGSGSSIGDIGRGGASDMYLEIREIGGTQIGTIMTSGFTGGLAPPGATAGYFLNFAVTGGTGAYIGVSGMLVSPSCCGRGASIQEDPSYRRINGGTQGTMRVYLIPKTYPQVVTTVDGPAIVHASDGSLVTTAKPAKSGEVLMLYATGLGPTIPTLGPGNVFSASPLQTANSPIVVTVGGQPAEVLFAGGYPGSADGFQVNFRVPSGAVPGTAALQLVAAFAPGTPVNVPLQ